jgi:hypothetical protein
MDKTSYKEQYKNVLNSLQLYWNTYGGLQALIFSPYLAVSLLITFLCFPIFSTPDNIKWYSLPISTIPNLLGFTLGGYAILLAFGNEKYLMILSARDKNDNNPSPFMNVNGAFVHFILVQSISFLVAIFSLSWEIKSGPFAFLGFFIFIYSLFTGIAAAFAILRLGKWYDIFLNNKYWKEKKEKESCHEPESENS